MNARMLLGCLCACLVLASSVSAQSDDVRIPPTITRGPQELVFSRPDQPIPLQCGGTGAGLLYYEWTKNNVPLNLNDVDRLSVQGGGELVTIKSFARSDEGYYQCKLSSPYGKVLSVTSHLQMASVGEQPNKDIHEQQVLEGQPFIIQAQPSKSVPKATYSWEIALRPDDDKPVPLILDQRIQIDESGNLHFAYAIASDSLNGKIYKLVTFNQVLDQRLGGSYTRISVTPASGGVQPFLPAPSIPANKAYLGVVGRNLTLRCFFNANPAVSSSGYTWRKPSSSLRNPLEHNSQKTELILRNIAVEDQGNYDCTALNTIGTSTQQLQLEVQAAPSFRAAPQNVNATEGDDVTFKCQVDANPAATVVWYIDAHPVSLNTMPYKMRLTADGQLIITSVCRDCAEGSPRLTDLMVVQCNASNVHGYILGSAYLNVLRKTTVTSMSTSAVTVKQDEPQTVEFQCEASSDPSTPVSIEWRKLNKDDHLTSSIVQPDDKVTFVNGGQLRIVVEQDNTDRWNDLVGTYTCSASNSYSNASKEFKLNFDGSMLVEAGFPWWILIIVFIILLFLILILCCCLCMQRNRGDTYPVDEKERKNGNDPEKEIKDNGFQDYWRPEAGPLKGSKGSLGSSARLHSEGGDGTNSLNEYGDVDPGKFTEDGSFVGAYTSTLDRKKGRME